MAWSYRKNARHRNPKEDIVRKAVCNKMKRKTKNEMAGWRVHGPEKDGNKRMERQSKGLRDLEAYCKGGQGPLRAVAPPKKKKKYYSQPSKKILLERTIWRTEQMEDNCIGTDHRKWETILMVWNGEKIFSIESSNLTVYE